MMRLNPNLSIDLICWFLKECDSDRCYLIGQSSANIVNRSGLTSFAAVVFSGNERSEALIHCSDLLWSSIAVSLNLRIHAWDLFTRPLFRWCLQYVSPTCETLVTIFSTCADCGIYLPQTALPFATIGCPCASYDELRSIQNMTKVVHHASQILKVGNHGDLMT